MNTLQEGDILDTIIYYLNLFDIIYIYNHWNLWITKSASIASCNHWLLFILYPLHCFLTFPKAFRRRRGLLLLRNHRMPWCRMAFRTCPAAGCTSWGGSAQCCASAAVLRSSLCQLHLKKTHWIWYLCLWCLCNMYSAMYFVQCCVVYNMFIQLLDTWSIMINDIYIMWTDHSIQNGALQAANACEKGSQWQTAVFLLGSSCSTANLTRSTW